MTAEQQIALYEAIDARILEVTKSKRVDYASADVLSNFKAVSAAAKALGVDVTNATGYSLFMVLLKIARLTNLLNEAKTPNNESIDDSFLDGINYFKLAYCTFKENTP